MAIADVKYSREAQESSRPLDTVLSPIPLWEQREHYGLDAATAPPRPKRARSSPITSANTWCRLRRGSKWNAARALAMLGRRRCQERSPEEMTSKETRHTPGDSRTIRKSRARFRAILPTSGFHNAPLAGPI